MSLLLGLGQLATGQRLDTFSRLRVVRPHLPSSLNSPPQGVDLTDEELADSASPTVDLCGKLAALLFALPLPLRAWT